MTPRHETADADSGYIIRLPKDTIKNLPWKWIFLFILFMVGGGSTNAFMSQVMKNLFGVPEVKVISPVEEKLDAHISQEYKPMREELSGMREGQKEMIGELKEINRTLGKLEGRSDLLDYFNKKPPVGGIP